MSRARLTLLVLVPLALSSEARAEGGTAVDAAAASDLAMPPVVPEVPYIHGARPRPDGAVQASVEDEALARWNVGGASSPKCPSSRPGFHVAPRVKVDTVVPNGKLPPRSTGKGVLSESGVLAQTRSRGYWPFRLCFEAGLRETPGLAGKTAVRLSIGRDGRVATAELLSTELGDREVARCVATRARALSYSPSPRRRTEVQVTVDLNPGDAALPDTCEGEDPGEGESPGTIDRGEAAAALARTLPDIAACYAEGLSRDPALWGRVALDLSVGPSGTITSATQHDSRFPDAKVVSCVVRAVKSAPLPAPVPAAVRLVWGIRLGADPAALAAASAGNQPSSGSSKSSVAESASPRLRLGP